MGELEEEGAFLPTIVIRELYKEPFGSLGKDTAETRLNVIIQSSFEMNHYYNGIARKPIILGSDAV